MSSETSALNKQPLGKLYLVPNTLGVAQADLIATVIPLAVQNIIATIPHFVVENAKSARAFLKALSINTPLARPLQQITMAELSVRTPPETISTLLQTAEQGIDIGLISEAGVPAVADPGASLVQLAHQRNIQVIPLVGPSSILLALMASGMNGQRFAFHGYLPQQACEREAAIRLLDAQSRQLHQTQILIETPYRNTAMLQALMQSCQADTWICAATDLSLASETIISQPASAWRRCPAALIESLHKRPTVFLLLGKS